MADRYFRRGTSKFYAATVAPVAFAAVTSAEVAAALALSDETADWDGFTIENASIETPDLGHTFVSSIPGSDTPGTPTFTIYELLGTQTIWDALAKGTKLWILYLPEGNATGYPTEVWPVRIGKRARNTNNGQEAATFDVSMAVIAEPNTDGARAA